MGISANQARFLSLTSRQIDLEKRIQDICQRRMRLSTQLENIATAYNNAISNRKMFTSSTTNQGIDTLSLANLKKLGYQVIVTGTDKVLGESQLKKGVETVTSPKEAGQITITSTQQFVDIVNKMNSGDASALSGSYILMGDVDLSSLGAQSGSLVKNAFTGSLDGNGYTISGLTINENSNKSNDGSSTEKNPIGLFSTLAGNASIKNLVLDNFNIKSTDPNVWSNDWSNAYSRDNNIGSLAGYVDSSNVVIDNVAALNTNISGQQCAAGGLVGRMDAGSITNSYASGAVSGGDYTAGLVAWVTGGNIDICNADVDVTANGSWVGGLIGEVYPNGNSSISRSYSTGNVTATGGCVGGLIGRCQQSLQDCYATGNVSGSSVVGGLVGDFYRNITDCYSTGDVTASSYAGALIGNTMNTMDPTSVVSNSFWEGTANGSTSAGYNNTAPCTITNSTYVANDAALSSAASAANWSATSYPATDLTGSGGSWDTSTNPPTLYKPQGYDIKYTSDSLEEGLRNGKYSLIKPADEFSQETVSIGGNKYEKVDWRTAPELYDELFGADDEDAENKYDKATDEINAQDKKLQLEDSSIEVEYKEVSSEKEAVKKILDTNSQSSFKYFS